MHKQKVFYFINRMQHLAQILNSKIKNNKVKNSFCKNLFYKKNHFVNWNL